MNTAQLHTRRTPGARHAATARAALHGIGAAIAAVLLWLAPQRADAQNNPYKIDDRLYRLYAEGSQKVRSPEALGIAHRMYSDAKALGDGKAQCLARSVEMFHYYYTRSDSAAFERAVRAMQDDALRTGYRQYYYFGFTNLINYRINANQYGEAFRMAQDFVNRVRKAGDHYGLFYALNSLGSVHQARNEIRMAIGALNEALDVGTRYVKDQDLATVYRKIAECYAGCFEYEQSYDAARRGYEVAKTNTIRLRLLYHMAFAQLKLQRYDRVEELYRQYKALGGGRAKTRDMSAENLEMLICHNIACGKTDEARDLITGMDRFFLARQLRLSMSYCQRAGRYKEMADLQQSYYGIRIANQDSMNLQDIAGMYADLYNQKVLIDNRRLEVERQRMLGERQRADIANARLSLANSQLELKNSSLELGRVRSRSELMQLSYNRRRLQNARLQSSLAAAKDSRTAARLHIYTVVAAIAVVLAAALLVSLTHRRIMRRLRGIHASLVHSHSQLKEARNRAVAADRVKTALIQNMTRDINTPLDSVVGFAQLIADGGATPEQRAEYFRQISCNTDALLKIVGEVLEKAQRKA